MWNTTEKPSSTLSNSGVTASGVTSRPVMPVPPVVTITSTSPDSTRVRIHSRIASTLSATMSRPADTNPASSTRETSSGPVVSVSSSRVSEITSTATRTGVIGPSTSLPPGAGRVGRSIRSAPTLHVVIVRGAGLDPALAVRPALLLPEGRAGLQIVHQEVGRLEGRPAMLGGGGDEHDRLARLDRAVAVHHQQVLHGKSRARLRLHGGDGRFGEAGIGVELEGGDRRAVGGVAGQAGEADDAAGGQTAGGEVGQQGAG